MSGYDVDLAYIHDAGFSSYCLGAAPGVLRMLRSASFTEGLVVDLGCGSGRWARELDRVGYRVWGVDQPRAFVRMARGLAPHAKFVNASLWDVALPACDAVTSLGECLNYAFDAAAGRRRLARLFARVYQALRQGGIFVFDVATPARIPEDGPQKLWMKGRGWAILVETDGDARRNTLTRRIIAFRKVRGGYRRSEEVHKLHLYRPDEVLHELRRAGFEARELSSYGRFRLPQGIRGFRACK